MGQKDFARLSELVLLKTGIHVGMLTKRATVTTSLRTTTSEFTLRKSSI